MNIAEMFQPEKIIFAIKNAPVEISSDKGINATLL